MNNYIKLEFLKKEWIKKLMWKKKEIIMNLRVSVLFFFFNII